MHPAHLLSSIEQVAAVAPILISISPIESPIRGLSISVFTLNKVLHLPNDTIQALHVFDQQAHASVYSKREGEGLSLFGKLL